MAIRDWVFEKRFEVEGGSHLEVVGWVGRIAPRRVTIGLDSIVGACASAVSVTIRLSIAHARELAASLTAAADAAEHAPSPIDDQEVR